MMIRLAKGLPPSSPAPSRVKKFPWLRPFQLCSIFTEGFLKKLERWQRGEIDQVSGASTVGGAKAQNQDSSVGHRSANMAPKAFLRYITNDIPYLDHLGKLKQIIDMPAKFFRTPATPQMAPHPLEEATAGAAHIYIIARRKGESP